MTHILKGAMLVFAAMALLVGCTTDPVNPNPQNPQISSDAAWRVTWYWDKDKDETSDYAQYTFYFRSNGQFEALQNSTATTGTWRITSSDGTQRLVISTSTSKPLSNLNDDWVILESGDQIIRLKDDNTTHLEELNFERVE